MVVETHTVDNPTMREQARFYAGASVLIQMHGAALGAGSKLPCSKLPQNSNTWREPALTDWA